jgi:hypothetical protein
MAIPPMSALSPRSAQNYSSPRSPRAGRTTSELYTAHNYLGRPHTAPVTSGASPKRSPRADGPASVGKQVNPVCPQGSFWLDSSLTPTIAGPGTVAEQPTAGAATLSPHSLPAAGTRKTAPRPGRATSGFGAPPADDPAKISMNGTMRHTNRRRKMVESGRIFPQGSMGFDSAVSPTLKPTPPQL